MNLLEVEEKGLRRPPTPLEAFKHHLASQPRIFVGQVFKILHRYVHFIPLFFYLFHGLFERFLACFFYYFFAYFLHISLLFVFTILPLISMPKKMKNSPNVNGGFKNFKIRMENSMPVFLILSHPLLLIFHGLKSKFRGLIF